MSAIMSMVSLFILGMVVPAQAGGGLDLSIEGLVWAVIYLIIAACIIGLLYYLVVVLIGPLLPPPFAQWVRIAFLVLVVLFAIVFLLHLLGRVH